MRIALIQSDLYWEDIRANLFQFEEKIWKIEKQVDLIVLPEMFSTGFSMNAANLAEPMNLTTHKWMKQMANQTNSVVCGSFIAKEKNQFFNRLLWVQPDGNSKTYDKKHLFASANEHLIYTSGTSQLMVEWRGWTFRPMICYDLRFPVWSRNKKDYSYDCLVYVANWPKKRATAWNTLLKARAIENASYCIGVNRVGHDGHHLYHSGDTSAYDFNGNQLALSHDKQETLLVHLDKELLQQYRKEFPVLGDADNFEMR